MPRQQLRPRLTTEVLNGLKKLIEKAQPSGGFPEETDKDRQTKREVEAAVEWVEGTLAYRTQGKY